MPEATNPFLDLMNEEEQRRRVAMSASVLDAADSNPDEVATRVRVARYLGYPTAVANALPDEAQREATLKRVQADTAAHPALQRKYADSDFAALAHDDSGALAAIGDALVSSARYVTGAGERGFAKDFAAGFAFDGSRGAAGVFQAAAEHAAIAVEGLMPTIRINEELGIAGGNPLRRLAEGFAMSGAAAKRTADRLSPPSNGIIEGGVSSGVRSAGQQLALLPFAPGEHKALLPQEGAPYRSGR